MSNYLTSTHATVDALPFAPGAAQSANLATWKAQTQEIVNRRLAQGATISEALRAAAGPLRAARRCRDLRDLDLIAHGADRPDRPLRIGTRGPLTHTPRIASDVVSTFAA